MTRTFTIIHTPNGKGFPAYTVREDHGRPFLDNPADIATDDVLLVAGRLLLFLQDRQPEPCGCGGGCEKCKGSGWVWRGKR